MSMSGDQLASEIKAGLDAVMPSPADLDYLKIWCGVIVNHIKNNAVVSTNVSGSATGVMPGTGSGTVVATGTGTIS